MSPNSGASTSNSSPRRPESCATRSALRLWLENGSIHTIINESMNAIPLFNVAAVSTDIQTLFIFQSNSLVAMREIHQLTNLLPDNR